MPAAGEDWRPNATVAALKARGRMLARLRECFAARGVLEVETPLLCNAGVTDPNLENLRTRCRLAGDAEPRTLFLQTSPEYAMKRLLAAGSGPIYQVCKAFRADESGRLHNPEFTIVEWYRPGFDADALIAETAELVAAAMGRQRFPLATMTYREAFCRFVGVDPLSATTESIVARAVAAGVTSSDAAVLTRDAALDLLLGQEVVPRLGRGQPMFLTEFPASQAALARLSPSDPRVAARFELFIDGIEIANGFHELGDATEQRRRFDADRALRAQRGLPESPVDERLLAALAAGLPECSGVAVGLDRLLMVALGAGAIRDVLSFASDVA